MPKNNYILTVDIGAYSLKIAEFFQRGNKLVLVDFDYIDYGLNLDDSRRTEILEKEFASVMSSKKIKAQKVYISISGQTTFNRFAKLPPVRGKEQKIKQLINYEAKQNIPFPVNEVTWDYQLISDSSSADEEIKVMFTVIKTDIVTDIVNIFENAGFETQIVGTSLTTTYNCLCAAKISKDTPIAVINVGCRSTTIVFATQQEKFFSRTIPLAGHTITQQISRELKIPFEKAEELKRSIGFVSLGSNYKETDSELEDIVSKIIRNVMLRLHGEIKRSINVYVSQQGGEKPDKILLAGGSSILKFMDQFLSDKLNLPVEYLNPFKLISIADTADKNKISAHGHMFPEIIGLGVNSLTRCPIEISLLPESIKRQHRIKSKTPYFYAIACSILVSLVIIYWGISSQQKMIDDLIITSTRQTNKIQLGVNEVKKLLKQLQAAKQDYTNLSNMLEGRNSWFLLLDNIQKALPDSIWVVVLEPTGKPIITKSETPQKELRSIFGRRNLPVYPKKVETVEKDIKDIEWIRIKAHTLVLFNNLKLTAAEQFKNNLLASPFFTDNSDEIVIVDFRTGQNDSDNINTFDIIIKLKKPIPL